MKEVDNLSFIKGVNATAIATFEQKIDWANYKISFQNFRKLKGRQLTVLPLCVIHHTEEDYDELHFSKNFGNISEFRYFIFFEDNAIKRNLVLKRWHFGHKWTAHIAGEEMSGTAATPAADTHKSFGFHEKLRPGVFDSGPNWRYSNGSSYRWLKLFTPEDDAQTLADQVAARQAEYHNLSTIIWLASSEKGLDLRRQTKPLFVEKEVDFEMGGHFHRAIIQLRSLSENRFRLMISASETSLEVEYELVYIDMNAGPQDTRLTSWPEFRGSRKVLRQVLSQISSYYVGSRSTLS